MDTRFMLIAALLAGVLSLALTSVMFTNREKGFTTSQWLMTLLIWLVLMVLAYIYQWMN
jgi:hypothetical protein